MVSPTALVELAFPTPVGMNRLPGYPADADGGVPHTRGDEPSLTTA